MPTSDVGGAMLPLILDAEELADSSAADGILVISLSKAEQYAEGHIPGAVHLDFASLNASRPPVGGLLPNDQALSDLFSNLGLSDGTHVVAYDDEGGGRASRLLWTLDVLGHSGFSLLNGGWEAWLRARLPVETAAVSPEKSAYRARAGEAGLAQKAYILSRLGAVDFALVDTRTPEEFSGENRRAERGGHIPGAVNFNWINAMDAERQRRIRPRDELINELAALGVTADKEVVAYCQTHHRSSHTYIVLKSLGFDRVRGYPGAWSEWGNDPATPVE
ncbi:MAG TPA: sulfurtransferase [Gammaproteobacteria bacterium]